MLQIDFANFNVENLRVFTSDFVDMCSANSHPFGFISRSKRPPTDILKFIFAALINQDKKVAFIRVDEDGSLARFSEFTKTSHTMNIMVQNTGGYAYYLNGKS